MGNIVHPVSRGGLHHTLYITNWRAVGVLDDKSIDVINASCDRYKIETSFSAFIELCKQKDSMIVDFTYINTTLSCPICAGRGKVDWIQKARTPTKTNYSHRSVSYYRRNKKRLNKLTPVTSLEPMKIFYGSEPNLLAGQELCSNCKGTGLHIIRNSEIIKTIDA